MADFSTEEFRIRPAKPEDCGEVMRLIVELATFEKMADQVKINKDVLTKDCFGDRPLCHIIVAEPKKDTSHLVGYAMYFPIYSTWEGISYHLEDLYVTQTYRGRSLGKRLMQAVTQDAINVGCSRLNLTVLGWNKQAKDMYTRYGYMDLTEEEDWHLMRLRRPDMETFVKK